MIESTTSPLCRARNKRRRRNICRWSKMCTNSTATSITRTTQESTDGNNNRHTVFCTQHCTTQTPCTAWNKCARRDWEKRARITTDGASAWITIVFHVGTAPDKSGAVNSIWSAGCEAYGTTILSRNRYVGEVTLGKGRCIGWCLSIINKGSLFTDWRCLGGRTGIGYYRFRVWEIDSHTFIKGRIRRTESEFCFLCKSRTDDSIECISGMSQTSYQWRYIILSVSRSPNVGTIERVAIFPSDEWHSNLGKPGSHIWVFVEETVLFNSSKTMS